MQVKQSHDHLGSNLTAGEFRTARCVRAVTHGRDAGPPVGAAQAGAGMDDMAAIGPANPRMRGVRRAMQTLPMAMTHRPARAQFFVSHRACNRARCSLVSPRMIGCVAMGPPHRVLRIATGMGNA